MDLDHSERRPKRYISAKKAAVRYDVSESTIWRWAGSGPHSIAGFPKFQEIAPNTKRLDEAELDAFDTRRTFSRETAEA